MSPIHTIKVNLRRKEGRWVWVLAPTRKFSVHIDR